jgi:hypothetical protein
MASRCALAGRATVTLADLRVQPGRVSVVPVALFSELQESVEVGAAREGVDLADTKTSATFSGEFTETLPLYGRFYQTVLTLAPGVLDPDQDGNPNVFGARESDFRTQVGGVANTDPLTGGFLSYINLESVEALEVIPAGAGPSTAAPRAASPTWCSARGATTSRGWSASLFGGDLLDGNGAAGGEAASFQRYQPFLQVSGPILRDRLWYRLSHEWIVRDDPTNVGGGLVVSQASQEMHSDQVTWQVTPRHKLAFQLQSDPTHRDHIGVAPLVPPESTYTLDRGGRTASLTWTLPHSPRLFAEGILAYQDHTEDTYPQVPGVRNDCGALGRLRKLRDAYCVVLDTGNTSGSWPMDSSDHRQRFTARAQVTYSPDTEKVGQQIKGGFAVENERYFRELSRGIEARIDVTGEFFGLFTGDYYAQMRIPGTMSSRSVGSGTSAFLEDQTQLRLPPHGHGRLARGPGGDRQRGQGALRSRGRGRALSQAARGGPQHPGGDEGRLHRLRPGRGLPPGAGRGPGVGQPAHLPASSISSLGWPRKRKLANLELGNTAFSPRLAVAWDPFGTGKTKLAATAGRYYDKIFLSVPLLGSEPAVTTMIFDATAFRGVHWNINSPKGGAEKRPHHGGGPCDAHAPTRTS